VDPAQIQAALRRSWWLVAITMALGLVGAQYVNVSTPPTYQASVLQFVSLQGSGESGGGGLTGSSLIVQRVKSYTQIVSSPQVLEPVIQDLRLPLTVDALGGHVLAANVPDTVLLRITVSDSQSARSAQVANAIAAQFAQVVQELERPTGGGESPVKVSITQPATAPSLPIAPRKNLNLVLGLMAGFLVGLTVALLRAWRDTSISSIEEIERLTGAVPIGHIPLDPASKTEPLVLGDADSPRAEAFRSVRTNLQFADVDRPPRVIVVTSPMAGDGKSTSACNIALTLALNASRVLLIEADLRRPLACDYLGLDNGVGLTQVLAGQLDIEGAIVPWGRGLLDVLPCGALPPNPSELLGSRQMGALLEELRRRYDFIVIDSAPLLPVTDAAVLTTLADGALIVIKHGATTWEQLERSTQSLSVVNAHLIGTVLNFAPRRRRWSRYGNDAPYRYSTNTRKFSARQVRKAGEGRQVQSPVWALPASGDGGMVHGHDASIDHRQYDASQAPPSAFPLLPAQLSPSYEQAPAQQPASVNPSGRTHQTVTQQPDPLAWLYDNYPPSDVAEGATTAQRRHRRG
jgi:capsular exopolysaccharide synthesis family protein